MKKNYAILILLFLIPGYCFSQPTITYNGNAPQIGDVYYYSNTEQVLDPGPAGANQTWDFTNINVTSTTQASIMNPASTPFGSEFSECNQAYHFDGTSTYIYNDISQNMMNHFGEGFDENPPMIIYYSDPKKNMVYPFSYNNNFSDTYFTSYTYEGMTTNRRGTSTVTADAWGSVTTPEDTYNNVLRIKEVISQVDSVWMDDFFIYATTVTYTHYSWLTSSSHTPVMAISIINTDLGTNYTSSYTTSSVHIANLSVGINKLQIYPNPVSDFVNISFNHSELSGIEMAVVDLTGKEMIWFEKHFSSIGTHYLRLDLSDLAPGIYFLKFKDTYATCYRKIIVY